jgi:hypothetical protein
VITVVAPEIQVTVQEIPNQLEMTVHRGDFPQCLASLTAAWLAAGVGIEAVEPILRFMEDHSSINYGQPGPLVHFVERFYGQGYEGKLLESVQRQPTVHLLWMLNRVINGTTDKVARRRFVAAMERAAIDSRLDAGTQEEATHFLERLSALNG